MTTKIDYSKKCPRCDKEGVTCCGLCQRCIDKQIREKSEE